ncbi:MAG: MmcQ/YjbR family DNA-binding protein [Bacteroidetes bacterium]|nr:MmcQ/YjbR family DNA-binding protein [Bacteroidota bacterium]
MHIEALREFALSLKDVEEVCPFGPDNLVYKVSNKMFLLLSIDEDPLRFNVKCNPEYAIQLREEFPNAVLPGYHMNKKHWNTIVVDGTIQAKQLQQFILDSYALVRR